MTMPTPMEFNSWYRSLPSNRILEYRDRIIDECHISKAVFYNWLNAVTPVPPLAQKVIIDIAGEPVLFERPVSEPDQQPQKQPS